MQKSSVADEVLRFAQGVEWDTDGLARTGAISALPRVTGCTEQIKSTLRLAYRSGDTSLRDVALEAAQEYFGIPYADIQWGNGDGDLVDQNAAGITEVAGGGNFALTQIGSENEERNTAT